MLRLAKEKKIGMYIFNASSCFQTRASVYIFAVVVVVQIADEKLFDLLQGFVFRFGHARVQVKSTDQRYDPVNEKHPGQGKPRLHFQKRFSENECHQKRQCGRQSTCNSATPI